MSAIVDSTAIETNPANMSQPDMLVTNKTSCNQANNNTPESSQESKTAINTGDSNEQQIVNNDNNNKDDQTDNKNDSSTLSTAFTISFEDYGTSSGNKKKLFGIRDSIRKFAPPKPNTIEKPRPSKSDNSNQDNSYMSIESAPGGFAKGSLRRELTNSCRSSGRKSDSSSRHSNISESAAFLIDKMLKSGSNSSGHKSGEKNSTSSLKNESFSPGHKKNKNKHQAHSSEDILDDEIDFSEDKSDNGTYIVGADPESDAARKKIDELFGVVKAAEASLLANSSKQTNKSVQPSGNRSSIRQSRVPERKPLNRERQEHINRLATGRTSSRSSSSSRPDTVTANHHHHRSRPEARHGSSRNSSCDRSLMRPQSGRPRRATSQSSRQSSNRDASDMDTRSSRSSLHNDIDIIPAEMQQANNPSMKFNRAFALRRARLGLGEPTRMMASSTPQTSNNLEYESLGNICVSPRRNNIMSNVQQKSGSAQVSSSQNLSRNDGGRFSLRMKNNAVQNRLNSMHGTGRGSQHGTLIDSYINKVAPKLPAGCNNLSSTPQQSASNHSYASTALPYQSGDELEATMSPSRYKFLAKSGRLQRKRTDHSDQFDTSEDVDSSTGNRFNYSAADHQLEHGNNNYNISENRACSSTGNRPASSVQLGALDSLVISAISGLSLKIRGSICDLMVEHAKRLPAENETRSVVEEILPQLTANATRPRSPTSIEEIDQSLYFDLAQTLKNLKKVEQMVDVIKVISKQLPNESPTNSGSHHSNSSTFKSSGQADGGESNTNSEAASLSPV